VIVAIVVVRQPLRRERQQAKHTGKKNFAPHTGTE
jgi:hypothetical protein